MVLVVLLLLQICFCFVIRDFMLFLSDNKQSDVIGTFNSTSRYLDDMHNIDIPYFEQIVGQNISFFKSNVSNLTVFICLGKNQKISSSV